MFLPTLFPAIAGAQGHYNIVYIMTDDHTAQMMSCYDKRYISTPNLDRIAADGVRFVNSYVANSLSGPTTNTASSTARSRPCQSSSRRQDTKRH